MSDEVVDIESFGSGSGMKPPKVPDYEVGYGKPPRRSQFQKGKSGNPKGRPKEKTNFLCSFENMLEEADVSVKNASKVMTKREALMRTLVDDAFKTNQKAFTKFMRLAKRAGLLEQLDTSKLGGGNVYANWLRSQCYANRSRASFP